MNEQILKLFSLWQEHDSDSFISAIGYCQQAGVYGAEYIELKLSGGKEEEESSELLLPGQPIQAEIDRDLSLYDEYSYR